MAASSGEEIALSSATSRSRKVADASAPRIGFAGCETTLEPRPGMLSPPFNRLRGDRRLAQPRQELLTGRANPCNPSIYPL